MLCRVLLAVTAVTLLGQTPVGQYDELKAALGLTDSQLTQLQQNSAAPVPRPDRGGNATRTQLYPPGTGRGFVIRGAQNEAALRLLDDPQRAKLAEIRKVLDRGDAAALAVGIGLMTADQWPGRCLCSSRAQGSPYSRELAITDAQAEQLDRISQSVQPKDRREAALAVFNEVQRAQLMAFEAAIQLAHEAISLDLIPRVPKGECLCH